MSHRCASRCVPARHPGLTWIDVGSIEGYGVKVGTADGGTVLDSTHLELTEPLALRSGARIDVAVSEDGGDSAAGSDSEEARPLSFRQREEAWCRTHQEALLACAGQWVVLEGEEIVVHGDDPVELVTQARNQGIRSPYIFFVEPPQPGVFKIGL